MTGAEGPCPRCGGTGFEIVEKDGRDFAQPCSCRRAAAAGPDAFLDACRIPRRYEHCSLGTFEPANASLTAALGKAMSYCNGYPYIRPEDEGLGLLFTGDNGVGKTHLAVSVLRELVTNKGVRGQFWDFHELIRTSFEDQIRAMVGELEPKERDVIKMRFGLDGEEPRTLQEIGEALGLSRERIRQIESKAKEKLRRSHRASELRGALN